MLSYIQFFVRAGIKGYSLRIDEMRHKKKLDELLHSKQQDAPIRHTDYRPILVVFALA